MSASWNIDDMSIMDMNDMSKRADLAETPAEIEARLELRWLAELREQNDARQEEITKWRGLAIAAISRDERLLNRVLGGGVNLTTRQPLTESERTIMDAAYEKMVTYMSMGMDFETIMTAVNSDDALMSCWEMLMVTMKLGGYDEPIQD